MTDAHSSVKFSPPDRSAALAVAALNNSALELSRPPSTKKRKFLPKSDIRNTFANCYYKAFNSGDKGVLKKTLDGICEPDVVLSHTFISRELNNFMPYYIEVFCVWF